MSQKYAFIAAEHADGATFAGMAPTIVQMLKWLGAVSYTHLTLPTRGLV